MARRGRLEFEGEICGFGTASGHRVVIGRWPRSPFGPVADVMLETPGGERWLLAPEGLADFVASTYVFDRVEVVEVATERGAASLSVRAGPLSATVRVGRRTAVGRLLALVPRRVAAAPAWAALVDPVARVALPGVRTRGRARGGRREWYGATDHHRLEAVTASWRGADLGPMADVDPPVRFGFGSAPRRPSIVALTTTVAVDGGG